MPATSPYTQNDYTSVSNYRPYELPINDIFRAYVAQNQFWDAGAQRVRSVYDNALNLKLSLEPNRELRDQFMQDAEKQMSKLSTMDLSDPSIQRQGFGIFKPIFQDEGIMYDDAMTRHYDKVRQDALSYRSKDNGKGYSDTNLAYAMDGYQEFVNSKDRMAGKKAYQNRKEYTPYYDPTDDINDVMKNCKASSVEAQSPYYGSDGKNITGYSTYTSNQSLSDAKVKQCFEAGLSDPAKRQMEINGYVAYKNHPEALANSYMRYNGTSIQGYNDQLLKNSTDIATLQNKKNDGKITPEESQHLQDLLDEKGMYEKEVTKLRDINGKLAKGDFTPLYDNYEGIAGLIYRDARTSEFGKAFSYDEFSKKMIADPVQMLSLREQFEAAQQEDDQRFQAQQQQNKINADMMLAQLKGEIQMGLKMGANGTLTLDGSIPPQRQSGIPTKEGYNEFQTAVTDLNKGMYDVNKSIAAEVLEDNAYMKNNADLDTGYNGLTVKQYLTAVKSGQLPSWNVLDRIPHLRDYIANNANSSNTYADLIFRETNIANQKAGMDAITKLKEKQVAQMLGGDYASVISGKVADLKPVTINGQTITPQDVISMLSGRPSNGLKMESYELNTSGVPGVYHIGDAAKHNEVTLNGRLISHQPLLNLISKVQGVVGETTQKLTDARNQVYGDQNWKQEPFYQVYPNSKNQVLKGLEDKLDASFPVKSGSPKAYIDAMDYQGGIKVIIPSLAASDEDAVKLALNAQKVTYNDKEKAFYATGVPNMDYSQQLGITPSIKTMAMTLQRVSAALPKNTYGTIGEPLNFPVNLGGNIRNYSITFKNTSQGIQYVLRDEAGNPRITSYSPDDMAQKIQGLQ